MTAVGEDTRAKWQPNFLSSLSSGLREQQRSGQFCDVTVIVDGMSFTCHKSVLCAVSPYFSAMFAHDMKESRESVVKLQDMTSEMFSRLLDCIYDGTDIVNSDNVQDVLEVATLMQMDTLLNRVEEYFKGNLALDNFVDIWYLAKKYNCRRLEQYIWKFMLDNFLSLFQSGDLSLLPVETLAALLSDDSLVAPSEDVVCEAAVQWVNVDTRNRLPHVPALIKAVRLPLCSPEYVLQRLSTEDSMNQVPEVTSAIQEALKFKMYTARKQDFSLLQTTQRAVSKREDVMVVIGGTDNIEYSGSGMRGYSFQRKAWYGLPSLPQNVGPYYALCTFGDDLYVSGGQYHREAFHWFQASTCTWSALSKLPSGRYLHSMTSFGDVIYVIGGEAEADDKTIYGYMVQSGGWDSYSELLDHVKYARTTAVGNSILIFGSIDNSNQFADVTQMFDVLKRQVTRLTLVKLPGVECQTIQCDDVTYIITTDGKITRLSKDLKTEHLESIHNFNTKRFGVVQYRGKLFLTTIPGTSKENSEAGPAVLIFDLSTQKVEDTFTIPNTRHGNVPWLCNATRLACAKITIGKHHLMDLNGKK